MEGGDPSSSRWPPPYPLLHQPPMALKGPSEGPRPIPTRSAPAGRTRRDLPRGLALADPRGAARIPQALLLTLDSRSGSPRAHGVWPGARVGRMGCGVQCGVAREAADRVLWAWVGLDPAGAEPGAGSRVVEAGALSAMGWGSRRAGGSRAWLLLLQLLRLPLPLWGVEAFQGECDVPRRAGEVAVSHHGGWEDKGGSPQDLFGDSQLYLGWPCGPD